jgi:pyruvate dehydrogenase E1 component alpha subunit
VSALPIVYVCENNQYGMGTHYDRVSAARDFSQMGQAYDMPGKRVDGMNVLAVYEEIRSAVETAKRGTPVLVEAKTYRYRGHSMSDPATYRSKEEVADYRRQDPILILKNLLLEQGRLTEAEYAALDEDAKKMAQEAAVFADESPEPELASLREDVVV